MSDVSGVSRRHFSSVDEEALRRDESTSSIVKRDTKTTVDIYGADRTWPEVKHHQQAIGHQKGTLVVEGVSTSFEATEIVGGVSALEHMVAATRAGALVEGGAAGAGVAAPVVALAVGAYEIVEAHRNAEAQARALAKDTAHVGLIVALDLPPSYKGARIEAAYKHVPWGFQSSAFRAGEALTNDPRGLAVLQLHADRGMNAARDLLASGADAAAALKANPNLVESFAKDAAFREGFQAYLYAKATLSAGEMKTLNARLDERDGWYAQSQIQFRV